MPSEKRLVGLRLDDKTYAALEKLARQDTRTVASMAEKLVRLGMQQLSTTRDRDPPK
jgi:hypothetical protein